MGVPFFFRSPALTGKSPQEYACPNIEQSEILNAKIITIIVAVRLVCLIVFYIVGMMYSTITTPSTSLTEATCIRVIDGDTIEVLIDGAEYKVRYIGIDTPEMNDSRPDVRALAEEATLVNKNLVDGKVVELEKDVSETDRYGRLLRYVYVGDTFVNAELVALGYAQVATYPPDVKYVDLFTQMQDQARDAGLGLWATR